MMTFREPDFEYRARLMNEYGSSWGSIHTVIKESRGSALDLLAKSLGLSKRRRYNELFNVIEDPVDTTPKVNEHGEVAP